MQRILIAACQKYLSGHDGTVYFSAGSRAEDLEREDDTLTILELSESQRERVKQ